MTPVLQRCNLNLFWRAESSGAAWECAANQLWHLQMAACLKEIAAEGLTRTHYCFGLQRQRGGGQMVKSQSNQPSHDSEVQPASHEASLCWTGMGQWWGIATLLIVLQAQTRQDYLFYPTCVALLSGRGRQKRKWSNFDTLFWRGQEQKSTCPQVWSNHFTNFWGRHGSTGREVVGVSIDTPFMQGPFLGWNTELWISPKSRPSATSVCMPQVVGLKLKAQSFSTLTL